MKLVVVLNASRGNRHLEEEERSAGGRMSTKKSSFHRMPRLERRNASKNIEYEAEEESMKSPRRKESMKSPRRTKSMYATKSFRIDGEYEGEVDMLCRNLGLSGPDDFAIPEAAWEGRKERSTSDLLPRSRLLYADEGGGDFSETCSVSDRGCGDGEEGGEVGPSGGEERFSRYGGKEEEEEPGRCDSLFERFSSGVRVSDAGPDVPADGEYLCGRSTAEQTSSGGASAGGGMKGPRPPLLKPPPAAMWMSYLHCNDRVEDEGVVEMKSPRWVEHKEPVVVDDVVVAKAIDDEYGGATMQANSAEELTGSSSFTTSNEDYSPLAAVDETHDKDSNTGLKRNITGWIKGKELGRGTFGTVYEAISDDGFFFAVKEVSLLDQGNNAQQCIQQLEQEIALLRNFEHKNIVQYLGTEKEEAKLFIFLELVTQGSLASLYEKYNLQDSQVSVYTRQILNGLKYLHDRNVVHRDIKCANILVDASGWVKLSDFGLAKEASELNMLKSCKGSVYWMAPEVIKQKKSYGPAADIWSLGCTVLEMLTRKVPYPDLEWIQALLKIGRGEKPLIPESLSKEAHDFVKQCTQVEPDDRPTALELLDHPFVKGSLSGSVSGSDHSSRGRRT